MKLSYKKILGFVALMAAGEFFISSAHAVTISMSLPVANPATSSSPPGVFVNNVYQFALLVSGVLAVGIIVYGGIKYMTSAGNPSAAGDAKEWIESALLGILLLAGAYFILSIVNPRLTNLTLPTLQPLTIAPSTSSGGSTNTGSNNQPSCTQCGGNCSFNSCGSGYQCSATIGSSGYSCQLTEYQFGGGGANFGADSSTGFGGSSGGAGAGGNF